MLQRILICKYSACNLRKQVVCEYQKNCTVAFAFRVLLLQISFFVRCCIVLHYHTRLLRPSAACTSVASLNVRQDDDDNCPGLIA